MALFVTLGSALVGAGSAFGLLQVDDVFESWFGTGPSSGGSGGLFGLNIASIIGASAVGYAVYRYFNSG